MTRFDQNSPVHLVSESRGTSPEPDEQTNGRKSLCPILDCISSISLCQWLVEYSMELFGPFFLEWVLYSASNCPPSFGRKISGWWWLKQQVAHILSGRHTLAHRSVQPKRLVTAHWHTAADKQTLNHTEMETYTLNRPRHRCGEQFILSLVS